MTHNCIFEIFDSFFFNRQCLYSKQYIIILIIFEVSSPVLHFLVVTFVFNLFDSYFEVKIILQKVLITNETGIPTVGKQVKSKRKEEGQEATELDGYFHRRLGMRCRFSNIECPRRHALETQTMQVQMKVK
ncbi:Hypothetical_protein [Hexamita inflata]|uniref:Hypothetical_protein n=1 Tax=Hexamita inflata TaxID=28002 RepID=A0ABP1H9C3_9EUKA